MESILGLASYYRRFVDNFFKTVAPIIAVLKEKGDMID